MQLRPVFLLAPEPERRPTRRQLLLGVLGGTVVGVGAGFGVARWARGTDVSADAASERVRWARRLAAPTTPDRELRAQWAGFLQTLHSEASHDDALWRGVDRLAEIVLDPARRGDAVDARLCARKLCDVIARNGASQAVARHHLLPQLEVLAR